MTNDQFQQPKFKNFKLSKNHDRLDIRIRKKIEPGMIIFVLVLYGFIGSLFYLLHYRYDLNIEVSDNFALIMRLIMLLVGVPVFFAMFFEIFKRNSIELDNFNLLLITAVLGKKTRVEKYDFKLITKLKHADPPFKGWKTNVYSEDESSSRNDRQYHNQKVYPSLQFEYATATPQKVEFADGLLPDEAEFLINLIQNRINANHQVI